MLQEIYTNGICSLNIYYCKVPNWLKEHNSWSFWFLASILAYWPTRRTYLWWPIVLLWHLIGFLRSDDVWFGTGSSCIRPRVQPHGCAALQRAIPGTFHLIFWYVQIENKEYVSDELSANLTY